MLSCLTGYLTPTTGTIELFDETFGKTDWRELRKKVGLVSSSVRQLIHEEDSALDVVISGNDAMIGSWGKVSKPERKRGLALMEQIECEDLVDRPWAVLSQGERQRVLIGRALMAQPMLLILDEPCAGLDPVARERFLNFLQRLGSGKQSPTLVLVTHHVEEIVPVFSHVLMLKAGRVFAAGEKGSVLNSTNFSGLFEERLRMVKTAGRYGLRMPARSSKVV